MTIIKRKIVILIILIIVLLSLGVYVFRQYVFIEKQNAISLNSDQKSSLEQTNVKPTPFQTTPNTSSTENIIEPIDSSTKFYRVRQVPISATSSVANQVTSTSSSTQQSGEGAYAYLFEGSREPNTSNIVGYFAHGAFAWYVPDWLVSNWKMKPFRDEGMIFTPNVRADISDFSDIDFDVSTSTELDNAENEYQTMLNNIPKDEIIITETLLNKSVPGTISFQIENSTRIYHIVAYTRDFKRITDMYFMDGNGKSLDLRFETKADIFPQFSDKIRDMVEGIGELKPPQG